MRFTIAFRDGAESTTVHKVTWEDGQLAGNEFVLSLVNWHLKTFGNEPFGITPSGPIVHGGVLEAPLAFLVFMQNNFNAVRVTGDIPILPPTRSNVAY